MGETKKSSKQGVVDLRGTIVIPGPTIGFKIGNPRVIVDEGNWAYKMWMNRDTNLQPLNKTYKPQWSCFPDIPDLPKPPAYLFGNELMSNLLEHLDPRDQIETPNPPM